LIENLFQFSDLSGNYRVRLLTDPAQCLLEKSCSGKWLPQYRFGIQKSCLTDFYDTLQDFYWHPNYARYRKLNCTKLTSYGYLQLKRNEFLINKNGAINQLKIETSEEISAILKHQFGMHEKFVDSYFCKDRMRW
jgi:arylamine N-acetyltransferase